MPYPRLTKCMPDETRHNPFHLLDKALRYAHCRTLPELGALDFGDERALGRLLDLVAQIDLHRAVAEARQQALLGALDGKGQAVLASLLDDHASHMKALAELQSLVRAVNVATPRRRALAGRSIYRCYALYAAADMARMDEDETVLLMALHQELDDAALRSAEGTCFAALAPEHLEALIRLCLPALSAGELDMLLALLLDHVAAETHRDLMAGVVTPLLSANSSAAA